MLIRARFCVRSAGCYLFSLFGYNSDELLMRTDGRDTIGCDGFFHVMRLRLQLRSLPSATSFNRQRLQQTCTKSMMNSSGGQKNRFFPDQFLHLEIFSSN